MEADGGVVNDEAVLTDVGDRRSSVTGDGRNPHHQVTDAGVVRVYIRNPAPGSTHQKTGRAVSCKYKLKKMTRDINTSMR